MSYEEWRDIQGFDNHYQVSSLGNIKTTGRTLPNGTVIKPGPKSVLMGKRGYCMVSISLNGKRRTLSVHRLVAIHFIRNPEKKEQVNHIDGDTSNNCVSNLEWVTQEENSRHARKYIINTRGVRKCSPNRWSAFITVDKKQKYIGIFKTEIEAIAAHDREYFKQNGFSPRCNKNGPKSSISDNSP